MHRNDIETALADIKSFRLLARRRLYRRSRLERYRAELVALRLVGATYRDLQVWLRRERRCRVALSTIYRYLQSLPEQNGTLR